MTQPGEKTLETILVVEDHPIVLEAVCSILEAGGYCVLTATNGNEAIRVEGATLGPIHLLLPDVVMPGMSGLGLALLLRKKRPDMRVMLMSGNPDDETLLLNHNWHFIEKPFLPAQLIERVSEMLHAPERSQGHTLSTIASVHKAIHNNGLLTSA